MSDPNPEELKECRRGAEWAAAVAAAAEVGLFAALADGPASAIELASRLGADARAVEILLGVLEALGLVAMDGPRAGLTGEGRDRYVDRSSDRYEGVAARRWRRMMKGWLRLDEALLRGGPLDEDAEDAEDEEDSLARFMEAMAARPSAQVERLVELCLRRAPNARTVLDLGGGPGVHSREFARRGLRVTLFDRPETIRHVATAYELEKVPEIELCGGDFLETLPDGPFDVILMANITHIYGAQENGDLIRRLADLQPPGGVVAILDFVRGRSPFAPLFAVTMLLHTEDGNTYGADLYQAWLSQAGYGAIEIEDVDEDRQLVSGIRRAGEA